MAKVALIACSEKKLPHAAQVKNLYTGERFRLALEWTKRNDVDNVFVLSARHGLLALDEVREPYDESLAGKTPDELLDWGRDACKKLTMYVAGVIDEVIVLAERAYAEPLRPYLEYREQQPRGGAPRVEYPLVGKSEAEQKAFLAS